MEVTAASVEQVEMDHWVLAVTLVVSVELEVTDHLAVLYILVGSSVRATEISKSLDQSEVLSQ
jgi:hypothetical protein